MSEENLLQQILEANQSFLGGSVRLLAESGNPLAIVTCIDRRLTGLIEPALGLPRNRAAVIRTAGNQVSNRNSDVLRSVAVCLFAKGAGEVFVVGHTDCAMAHFSAAEVAESFRRAGVPREAFGAEDLRTWFGALANERANVIESVAALRRSAFVPASTKVHGLMMDTASGAIEVLVNGSLPPAPAAATIPEPVFAASGKEKLHAIEFAAATGSEPPIPPLPPKEPEAARKPIVIAAPEPVMAPKTYVDAVLQLRQALAMARQNPKLRRSMSELMRAIEQERDPARVFAALQRLERECAPLYPEIAPAVEILKSSLQTRKGALNFMDMMRRILD
jgi:carbonic anhydrase